MYSIGLTLNPATIADGASLSAACPLGALTLVGISMPAVWATAGLTFQVSPDGGTTWQELVDQTGAALSVTAAANQFVIPVLEPSYLWRGINMVKVRSGTSGTPVVQSGGTIVNLVTRNENL